LQIKSEEKSILPLRKNKDTKVGEKRRVLPTHASLAVATQGAADEEDVAVICERGEV